MRAAEQWKRNNNVWHARLRPELMRKCEEQTSCRWRREREYYCQVVRAGGGEERKSKNTCRGLPGVKGEFLKEK